MITHPTTDVLIQDCCRELGEEILPSITDDTVRLRLVMTMTVLANAAVRAAHELAWMRAETSALLEFARSVAEAHESDELAQALEEVAAGDGESLHLHDVADVYARAGRAFEAGLRVAREAGAEQFVTRAVALLRARIDTEKAVMAGYAVVGR